LKTINNIKFETFEKIKNFTNNSKILNLIKKKKNEKKIIKIEELLINNNEIKNIENLKQNLSFLNEIGEIIYFEKSFPEIILIDFNFFQIPFQNLENFFNKLKDCVFLNNTIDVFLIDYDEIIKKNFFKLLFDNKICFPILNEIKSGKSIFPFFLQNLSKENYLIEKKYYISNENEFIFKKFIFKIENINLIFINLISFLNQYIYFYKKWKNCFIIKNKSNYCLIKSNNDNKINFIFKGKPEKDFGEFIDLILQIFNFISRDEKIIEKIIKLKDKKINFSEIINHKLNEKSNILFYGFDFNLKIEILSYFFFFNFNFKLFFRWKIIK
jgi:hypothetical protein